MLISTLSYNAIPFTTVFLQFFTFLLLSSHLLHATVCIIKSFLCHNIKQAMSYHIMEFYVTTCHMSRLSWHPYMGGGKNSHKGWTVLGMSLSIMRCHNGWHKIWLDINYRPISWATIYIHTICMASVCWSHMHSVFLLWLWTAGQAGLAKFALEKQTNELSLIMLLCVSSATWLSGCNYINWGIRPTN